MVVLFFVLFFVFVIVGGVSYMFLRFRLPYRAPRLLLHCLQAATRFSSALMPGVLSGHLSTSSR